MLPMPLLQALPRLAALQPRLRLRLKLRLQKTSLVHQGAPRGTLAIFGNNSSAFTPHQPTPAGFTPRPPAALTAGSASEMVGTPLRSEWIHCAFQDQTVKPHTMSIYKLNTKEWVAVSLGTGPA